MESPLQIKQLFFGGLSEDARTNLHALTNFEPFENIQQFGLFYNRYLNIIKIQAFGGFEKGTKNIGIQMKSPVWRDLTATIFAKSSGYLLCRQTKYTNKHLIGNPIKIMDLGSPYDEYFILDLGGAPAAADTTASMENAGRALVSAMDKHYRALPGTEYTTTNLLSRRGTASPGTALTGGGY